MNYDKKTIRDIDVSGKKILLRCDFNVPHDKATGIIHDDTRIVSTLPTIRYLLLEHNAAVILLPHGPSPRSGRRNSPSSPPGTTWKLHRPVIPLTKMSWARTPRPSAPPCSPARPWWRISVPHRGGSKTTRTSPGSWPPLADIFVFDAFGAPPGPASTEGRVPALGGGVPGGEGGSNFMGKALEEQKRPGGHPGRVQGL